jgi:hypothetical protein
MSTRKRNFRRADAGTALVEFAVAISTILTVLLGIIDIGRAVYAYDWVSNAARTATRFAIVRGTGCTDLTGGCPARQNDVVTYVKNDAIGIDPNQLQVTTACFVTHNIGSAPPCAPRAWVQVTVKYNFKFLSPFTPFFWTMKSVSERVVQN